MISINWLTQVIYVPQSYLTSLGGGNYELDVNQFRLDLKDIEDSETGQVHLATHRHNTTVTLSGVTYARTVEIINGYTIEFEDTGTSYRVQCTGANHNIADVQVVNRVSLLIGNSAGLIQVASGSGVLPADITAIADAVWDESVSDHLSTGSTGRKLKKTLSLSQYIGLK